MCYLVAKKFNNKGSIAFKTEHGVKLGTLSKYLTLSTLENEVQIVTINNPDDYLEYSPYKFIDNEVQFISEVFEMKN
ncbi:hypothetical protein KPL39_14540 [Clostridium gasigenes]|uniref:DUF6718 family protein n=1 Tax=Clostridium gasigenes TaxID=94869 RepID=UPI001C0BEB71|nr:DUF6718 family protein [Clostridium gasigenes]MBU3137481.1 hypothetical protein [Clostridium gasigenes]